MNNKQMLKGIADNMKYTNDKLFSIIKGGNKMKNKYPEPEEGTERPLGARIMQPMIDKKDNWEHRSSKMKCKTCMWFVGKNEKVGRCRRHSPASGQKIGFPVVFETDWCGDHKLDETKI